MIALAFLRVAWPYLLVAAVLAGGYYWAEHVHCSARCRSAEAKTADLRAQIAAAAAREAATQQRLDSVAAAQEAIDKLEQEKRNARFAPLQERARTAPGTTFGVARSTLSLLHDASRAANAGNPAAPSGEREPAADPVPDAPGPILIAERDLADFVVAASAAYADAVGQWRSCVNFYQSLQAAERQP